MSDYKIKINPVFERPSKFFWPRRIRYVVQSKPVRIGFQFKNIDQNPTPRAQISNIQFKDASGGNLNHGVMEQFSLPEMNPGSSFTIWLTDIEGLVIKGSCWIEMRIVPSDADAQFVTYQQLPFSSKPEAYTGGVNSWGLGIFIRGDMEEQQAKTNVLISWLTLLVFLDGAWGLKNILHGILSLLSEFFHWISVVLGSFAK
jgi:hypothetical protein